MSRHPVRMASLLATLALLLSACGDGTEDMGAEAATGETTPATEATDETTDVGSDPDDAAADAGDATEPTDAGDDADEASEPTDAGDDADEPAADVVIDGSLSRGEVKIENRRFDVPIGSTVLITFESDEVEHIHLHGYDLLADLEPGQPAEIAFVADSPGTFEVELEDSGRFLFELLVR